MRPAGFQRHRDALASSANRGNHTPMILVSAEGSIESRLPQGRRRPTASSPSPSNASACSAAIAEFLLADAKSPTSGAPIYTNLDAADPTMPLVPNFIDEVRKYRQAISAMMRAGRHRDVSSRVAFQIRGSGADVRLRSKSPKRRTRPTPPSAPGRHRRMREDVPGPALDSGRIRATCDAAWDFQAWDARSR